MSSPQLDSQIYLPLEEPWQGRDDPDRLRPPGDHTPRDLGFTVEWQVTSAWAVDDEGTAE